MSDTDLRLRNNIRIAFRLNMLSITADTCNFLYEHLSGMSENRREQWLNKIIEFLQNKQTLSDPVIQINHVTAALQECFKSDGNNTDDMIQVISAFDVPRFNYNPDSKKFVKCSSTSQPIFHSALSKILLFKNRYDIIKQRLNRHELLNKTNYKFGTNEPVTQSVKLNYIDHLLSSANENIHTIVLGLLSQLKEGKYFLEDPTGILPIDNSKAVYHPGIFTENCFILAEGVYIDGVLRVNGLAHPPPESSKISQKYFGNANTFGGPSEVSLKHSSRMLKFEEENEESMIVFVADIFLDQIKVIQKLRLFFSGFDEDTPAIIVLMGNFLSIPKTIQYFHLLCSKFNELAEIISSYQHLMRETLFIIIPGPLDSPSANILPIPQLPQCIVDEFQKKIPKSIFATNPCRIQYGTQEIVLLREDILTKMCRNCIHFPNTENIPLQFSKTIISQSHMAPLPLSVCPLYWAYDNSLLLYPLPDVIVIADQIEAFSEKYKDAFVVNPSSFSKRKFIFKVYIPGKRQIEDSQIPDI